MVEAEETEVAVEEAEEDLLQQQQQLLGVSAIKAPNIRICQQESGPGVVCISGSEDQLIFAMNRLLVPGKMSSRPRQTTNEGLTSSK